MHHISEFEGLRVSDDQTGPAAATADGGAGEWTQLLTSRRARRAASATW